jgi:hypothetical protein
MPGGDRTGPIGLGPLTGRRMGYCTSNYGRSSFGFGFRGGFRGAYGYGRGYGRGFGRDYGNFYTEDIPVTSEKTALENDIKNLKEQLSFLENRLSDIESKGK